MTEHLTDQTFAAAVLQRVAGGAVLTEDAAAAAMSSIMTGRVPPAQVAGFAVAVSARGVSVDELVGMAREARRRAAPVVHDLELLDTCGSGGDGLGTFNISTAAALVVAAAGVPVAKHGNRSSSSACGSADVLEELGVDIELGPDDAVRCLQAVGITFLFAPVFHPGFRHVAPTRRELGVRTVFNLLGPLCNPARVSFQILGVPRPDLVGPMAEVLHRLGVRRVTVVHAEDGMDELSTTAPSHVTQIHDGVRRSYRIDPADLGLAPARPAELTGGGPAVNARMLRAVLDGVPGPARDVVMLNAAAGLYTANRVDDLTAGLSVAAAAVDSGAARDLLVRWSRFRVTSAVESGVPA